MVCENASARLGQSSRRERQVQSRTLHVRSQQRVSRYLTEGPRPSHLEGTAGLKALQRPYRPNMTGQTNHVLYRYWERAYFPTPRKSTVQTDRRLSPGSFLAGGVAARSLPSYKE